MAQRMNGWMNGFFEKVDSGWVAQWVTLVSDIEIGVQILIRGDGTCMGCIRKAIQCKNSQKYHDSILTVLTLTATTIIALLGHLSIECLNCSPVFATQESLMCLRHYRKLAADCCTITS